MKIFTLKKIYIAYFDCRKTKRNTGSALEFEFELEKNLQNLLRELQTREYEPGKSICFVVRSPKPREIFAAGFRDRIVHHLLVNELIGQGERMFIHDSYACRKNKGTHKALERLRTFLRRVQAGKRKLYFLQLDIDAFFMSINKDILFSLLGKIIKKQNKSAQWEKEVFWLTKKIVFHNPKYNYQMNSPIEYFKLISNRKSLFKQSFKQGLPIGNYSSQFFANVYLNELDQYVKRKLKCRMYLRYVDDFVLLNSDPAVLKKWMKQIRPFLRQKLQLKISERKIRLQEVGKGIDWLGYFVKPDYVLARRAVVARFKKKIDKYTQNGILENNLVFKSMINSYFGHFSHADCKMLREKYSIYLK